MTCTTSALYIKVKTTINTSFSAMIENASIVGKQCPNVIDIYRERYVIYSEGLHSLTRKHLRSILMLDLQTNLSFQFPDLPVFNAFQKIIGVVFKQYFYVFLNSENSFFRISLSNPLRWECIEIHIPYTCIAGRICSLASNDKSIFLTGNDCIWDYDPEKGKPNEDIILPSVLSNTRLTQDIRHVKIVVLGSKIYGFRVSGSELSIHIYNIPSRAWRSHNLPIPFMAYEKTTAIPFGRWIFLHVDMNDFCGLFDTYTDDLITLDRRSSIPIEYQSILSVGNSKIAFVGVDPKENIILKKRKEIVPNWYIIREFLLLRKLVHEGRADLIVKKSKVDNVIEKVIANLDSDMFQLVISFV